MRLLPLLPFLLLATPAIAQDKLPPAKPLAYAEDDTAAVLATINRLFAALEAGDSAAMLALGHPDAPITVSVEDGAERGIHRSNWAKFVANFKPGPQKLQERLLHPAVEIDGDIAMVWSAYVFRIDGKLSHCGTDHFGLVREDGRWKIASAAWTQRTTNCPGQ